MIFSYYNGMVTMVDNIQKHINIKNTSINFFHNSNIVKSIHVSCDINNIKCLSSSYIIMNNVLEMLNAMHICIIPVDSARVTVFSPISGYKRNWMAWLQQNLHQISIDLVVIPHNILYMHKRN